MPDHTRSTHYVENALNAPHLPVAGYLIYIGAATLADPGTGLVADALPWWLTTAWAAALTLGGLLIVAGVATAATRAESAGHGLHFAGLCLYTATAIAERDVGTGTVVVLLVLASVSALRLRQLSRSREAQQEAARLLRGDR